MKSFTFRSTVKLCTLVLSASLLTTLAGCDLLTGGSDAQKNAGAGMHRMPQVGIQKAEPTQVPKSLTFTGRAVASTIAEVRPQVDGIITKRLFEEGQHVKKGDILYQIDDETYQALYDNAQAEIKKSEALLTNAELKVNRNQRLVKINAVSEQVLDDALATLREAKANLEANKAALKTAAINLARTKIKAPVSGMIGRSNFTEGALVMNNQSEVMATIQQLNPIYVDFSLPSYYAATLKREMKKNPDVNIEKFPVTITFDNGEKFDHTGHIKLSEFSVDASTDTIILRTEFDNPNTQLLPGMFIRGSVMTGYFENVYLVPSLALSRDVLGHAFLMVLTDDGTVTVRPVKEGGLYKESWIITDGLQPGDQVITKGLQYIRPGIKASIIGAKPPAESSATEAQQNAKEGK